MAKTAKKTASSPDLFAGAASAARRAPPKDAKAKPAGGGGGREYTAADIEVLEGLEPVRRRPGMYIGGTDEKALHHLFAEIIDNAMDEAIAGHADWIEVELEADGFVSVTDNGAKASSRLPSKVTISLIRDVWRLGRIVTSSPGRMVPEAIVPQNPRKFRCGRLTNCTGKRKSRRLRSLSM